MFNSFKQSIELIFSKLQLFHTYNSTTSVDYSDGWLQCNSAMHVTAHVIFPTGGSAEKNGQLCAGDELLNVNGSDVTVLSRIEAWGLMKRLPDGPVALTVRHRLNK